MLGFVCLIVLFSYSKKVLRLKNKTKKNSGSFCVAFASSMYLCEFSANITFYYIFSQCKSILNSIHYLSVYSTKSQLTSSQGTVQKPINLRKPIGHTEPYLCCCLPSLTRNQASKFALGCGFVCGGLLTKVCCSFKQMVIRPCCTPPSPGDHWRWVPAPCPLEKMKYV